MQDTLQQPDSPARSCPSCGAVLRGMPAYCPSCGAALRVTTGRLSTEQVLAGRYRIVRMVARGGMGAVYLAEDMRLGGAPVAVKEMASSFVRGDTSAFVRAVAEFQREAAMLARLRHPHLPRVSDQFDEQGKHYLVMEFVEGRTLSETLRHAGGRLPLHQALDYADQLCDVLAYLHSQRPPIIYRDLKPSNVMVVYHESAGSRMEDRESVPRSSIRDPESAQLVLIDFGIARFYRPDQTGDTAIYGTTGYAPPEQYGNGQTDARTDIYALGVLLHQMLTGHDPTTTPFALPPPRALDPTIPPQIAQAIERATASDRSLRFDDVAAFRAALRSPGIIARNPPLVHRAAVQSTAAAHESQAAPAAARRKAKLRFLGWTTVGIAGALLVGALALLLLRSGGAGDRATTPTPGAAGVVESSVEVDATSESAGAASPVGSGTTSGATDTAPADITPAVDSGGSGTTPQASGPGQSPVLLRPSEVKASNTADPGKDAQGNQITYEPENAVDGRSDTAWRVDGDGVNQWLELDFPAEVGVQAIGIIPGYDKIDPSDGSDRFAQNRVVKIVRLEFSDGTSIRVSFTRQRDMQFVPLGGIRTRSIRIVIEATYAPPAPEQGGRDFTPISEVQVQGTP